MCCKAEQGKCFGEHYRALVTSDLGFTAHNAFPESDGEDGPFLPKGRRHKIDVVITGIQQS